MEPSLSEIKAILAEAYGLTGRRDKELRAEDVEDDVFLFDYDQTGRESLEFDSLDALEVAAMLEDRYGVAFPYEIDPERISTPRRIVEFVSELMAQAEEVE